MNKGLAFFKNKPKSSNSSFGYLWAALFSVIFLWQLLTSGKINFTLLTLSVLLGLISFIYPKVLYPFNYVWNLIGLSLHKLTNPIVMALIFFLVLTPISALIELLGKDFLLQRRNESLNSYWIKRDPPGPSPESLKRQF